MSNKKQQQPDELQSVDQALTKSEQFIEQYRKPLLIGFSAVVLIVVAIVLYFTYYLAPRNIDAADHLAGAIYYFEQDSFALALDGDGANPGFAEIADTYGATRTADLASLYAGICHYHLGQYDDAIRYLKHFDANTVNLRPANLTLIGDCYVATQDYKQAIRYFEKAAAIDNDLTAPRALSKAGICYEATGDYTSAIRCYQTIKDRYFATQLATEMDKRIARCHALTK